MKFIKHAAQVLVGLTFIFSGFVKGIDPWGSAYKFSDYFTAMQLDWLHWAALPLGMLLSFAEFAIGVALLFNVFVRIISWFALVFMVFFTGLTLWIAIENPVTDCGCFGDALVISNWATFYKNMALLVLTLVIFYFRRNMKDLPGRKAGLILAGVMTAAYVAVVVHSYNHLPLLDFRPYKTGTNILEAMSVPEDAPQDVYENIFYYTNKNTGEVERFTEKNYPWQDTTNWVFHEMESFLVSKGYEPPIHDFRIETPEGDDILDFFLYDDRYVFMVIAHDLNKSDIQSQEKINTLGEWAIEQGMAFIGLTSSLPAEIEKFTEQFDVPYEFFAADEVTLKTIIRSNPGLLVLKDATIIAKYHYNDIPQPNQFERDFVNK